MLLRTRQPRPGNVVRCEGQSHLGCAAGSSFSPHAGGGRSRAERISLARRCIGWYNTTVGLVGLVASLVAGLLWDQGAHAAVFLFGAGFAVVGGIALLALVPDNARPIRSTKHS